MGKPIDIVATRMFERAAKKLLDRDELARLSERLLADPFAGDVIPGSLGARKLRWALPGRGKSGGARVIHYFHAGETVFLLTTYAKNVQSNLTHAQLNEIRAFIRALKEAKP